MPLIVRTLLPLTHLTDLIVCFCFSGDRMGASVSVDSTPAMSDSGATISADLATVADLAPLDEFDDRRFGHIGRFGQTGQFGQIGHH